MMTLNPVDTRSMKKYLNFQHFLKLLNQYALEKYGSDAPSQIKNNFKKVLLEYVDSIRPGLNLFEHIGFSENEIIRKFNYKKTFSNEAIKRLSYKSGYTSELIAWSAIKGDSFEEKARDLFENDGRLAYCVDDKNGSKLYQLRKIIDGVPVGVYFDEFYKLEFINY